MAALPNANPHDFAGMLLYVVLLSMSGVNSATDDGGVGCDELLVFFATNTTGRNPQFEKSFRSKFCNLM